MSDYNWRKFWQPRTRGGFEVVDARIVDDCYILCAWDGAHYCVWNTDGNGRLFNNREDRFDLLPVDPADYNPLDQSRYERELSKICDMVQRVHPVGEVKGIGLMEVATAVEELLFPPAQVEGNDELLLQSHCINCGWNGGKRRNSEIEREEMGHALCPECGVVCDTMADDRDDDDEPDPLLVEARRILSHWSHGRPNELVDLARKLIARLESGELVPVPSTSLFKCPQCGKRGVQYDPRCKSFICLMEGCNAAWSLHKPQQVESGERGCDERYKSERKRLAIQRDEPAEVAPTLKFKVGDRVRCVSFDDLIGCGPFEANKAYTVCQPPEPLEPRYITVEGMRGGWCADRFELVAPSDQETIRGTGEVAEVEQLESLLLKHPDWRHLTLGEALGVALRLQRKVGK